MNQMKVAVLTGLLIGATACSQPIQTNQIPVVVPALNDPIPFPERPETARQCEIAYITGKSAYEDLMDDYDALKAVINAR